NFARGSNGDLIVTASPLGLPKLVDRMRTVGHQVATGDEVALNIHRRELVSGRKLDDQIAMNRRRVRRSHPKGEKPADLPVQAPSKYEGAQSHRAEQATRYTDAMIE